MLYTKTNIFTHIYSQYLALFTIILRGSAHRNLSAVWRVGDIYQVPGTRYKKRFISKKIILVCGRTELPHCLKDGQPKP